MSEGRRDRRGRQVKTSILGTFAAVVLFVVAAFFVTVYLLERQTLEADLTESAAAVDTLLRQKVEKEAKVMHGIVMAMFGNRELEAALVDQDRDELFRLVAPLFESIRAEHGMTHLYFTAPDLVSLLRLHEREQFGDTIDRYTTVQARERGQTSFGLELGSLGTLLPFAPSPPGAATLPLSVTSSWARRSSTCSSIFGAPLAWSCSPSSTSGSCLERSGRRARRSWAGRGAGKRSMRSRSSARHRNGSRRACARALPRSSPGPRGAMRPMVSAASTSPECP